MEFIYAFCLTLHIEQVSEFFSPTNIFFIWKHYIIFLKNSSVLVSLLQAPCRFESYTVSFCLIFGFSVRAPGKYHTTIYPYIHQTCNNRKSEDQVRSVVIPDVDPTDVPPNLNFSMAAGDFLEVYTEEGTVCLSMFKFVNASFSCQGAHKVSAT